MLTSLQLCCYTGENENSYLVVCVYLTHIADPCTIRRPLVSK